MRDELENEYFHDVHERHWAGGIGHPAGIYWLDGRVVMAAHSSAAEERLLAHGAIHIGTLLFEHDPMEGRHPGRNLARVPAHEMAQQPRSES